MKKNATVGLVLKRAGKSGKWEAYALPWTCRINLTLSKAVSWAVMNIDTYALCIVGPGGWHCCELHTWILTNDGASQYMISTMALWFRGTWTLSWQLVRVIRVGKRSLKTMPHGRTWISEVWAHMLWNIEPEIWFKSPFNLRALTWYAKLVGI